MERPVIIKFDNGTIVNVNHFCRINRASYGKTLIIHNPGDVYTVCFKSDKEMEDAISLILNKLNADVIEISGTKKDV